MVLAVRPSCLERLYRQIVGAKPGPVLVTSYGFFRKKQPDGIKKPIIVKSKNKIVKLIFSNLKTYGIRSLRRKLQNVANSFIHKPGKKRPAKDEE